MDQQRETREPQNVGFDSGPSGGGLALYIAKKLFQAALLLGSNWILFALPRELTILSWVSFAAAVLLFCLGFFPLMSDLPGGDGGLAVTARNAALLSLSAALPALGLYRVYIDGGSERSMAAAVLLMIEAPVIFSQTDDRITDAPLARRLMLLLAVAAAGLGVWLFFQYVLRENGRGQVETATLLWIGSVLLFHAGSSGGGTDSESGGTGGDE